jgi:hypothetical protein
MHLVKASGLRGRGRWVRLLEKLTGSTCVVAKFIFGCLFQGLPLEPTLRLLPCVLVMMHLETRVWLRCVKAYVITQARFYHAVLSALFECNFVLHAGLQVLDLENKGINASGTHALSAGALAVSDVEPQPGTMCFFCSVG